MFRSDGPGFLLLIWEPNCSSPNILHCNQSHMTAVPPDTGALRRFVFQCSRTIVSISKFSTGAREKGDELCPTTQVTGVLTFASSKTDIICTSECQNVNKYLMRISSLHKNIVKKKLDGNKHVLFHYSCPMANVLERLFVTDPILERQKVKVDYTSADRLFISLF